MNVTFQGMIDEQIRTFDESHDRHFIDMYIRKMREQADDPASTFSCKHFSSPKIALAPTKIWSSNYADFRFSSNEIDEQLLMTCVDFGFPPFSALSTTMTFMVQLVCHKPEIQRKIQQEIDQVIGEGRLPTLDDRVK